MTSPRGRAVPSTGAPATFAPGTTAQPATLVLSRRVKPGHEQAYEAVLDELMADAERSPGHLSAIVLRPPTGTPPIYTIVGNFASREALDEWVASPGRTRLIARRICMPKAHSISAWSLESRGGWRIRGRRSWCRRRAGGRRWR